MERIKLKKQTRIESLNQAKMQTRMESLNQAKMQTRMESLNQAKMQTSLKTQNRDSASKQSPDSYINLSLNFFFL